MTGRPDNVHPLVALPQPEEPFLTREQVAHELQVHVNRYLDLAKETA